MPTPEELERLLRNLSRFGKLLKERPYRQVWRFEWNDRGYYLKFYPRTRNFLERLFRGSPAWREFSNLQLLQKRSIPSPRAVAHLAGYTLSGVKGDAVIIEAIEPSAQLDLYLNDLLLRGDPIPDRHRLGQKLLDLVHKLGQARLGHSDLHLGNILLKDDNLYVLDGYSVRPGGLRMKDVMLLAHSVSRFATATDLIRGWDLLGGGRIPRRKNPVRRRYWRKLLEATTGENAYFGRLHIARWRGHFYKYSKFPRRWAPASRMVVAAEDWQREWPNLLARMNADQLEILKRTASGDVLAGEIILSGHPIQVVIKRIRRRKWHRYFTEIGRGSRPRRAWKKAWSLIVRDVPTAWPLLVMQTRTVGCVTDSLVVFQRVAGNSLALLDLDSLACPRRQDLFRRLGRTLRNLERAELSQYDSKSTNWIIVDDPIHGPVPIIVDVDGIRRFVPDMWPIDRLLRSMREHPQYTRDDSRQLCLGYAPYARLVEEKPEAQAT